MKVKRFTSDQKVELEDQINQFLKQPLQVHGINFPSVNTAFVVYTEVEEETNAKSKKD